MEALNNAILIANHLLEHKNYKASNKLLERFFFSIKLQLTIFPYRRREIKSCESEKIECERKSNEKLMRHKNPKSKNSGNIRRKNILILSVNGIT